MATSNQAATLLRVLFIWMVVPITTDQATKLLDRKVLLP
jgi:hypothetical protein